MAAAFMRNLPWIILSKISKRFDDEEDKDFLNSTAKIHEKELGNTSILYGISDSTKVEDFKKQNNFNSTYEVKIYDKNDKELQDNNIIGTGSKVKLYKQGKIVKEYTVILYGDTTGDGKITSVDALAIIKHINNKIPFTKEEYIEAGKVRKESGKNLTSVDALATVKSVNGKYEITKKDIKMDDDGIIVSEKLAKLLKLKKNSYAKLTLPNNKKVNVKVSDITENYIEHYVYISPKLYKKLSCQIYLFYYTGYQLLS